VILIYGLSNSSNCNDLECPWRLFPYCKSFKFDISYLWHVVHTLCMCRSSCYLLALDSQHIGCNALSIRSWWRMRKVEGQPTGWNQCFDTGGWVTGIISGASETHTHTHTTVLWPSWILYRTTPVSRHQKVKTRKVKPIWIYWSKRQWVAVAFAVYAQRFC